MKLNNVTRTLVFLAFLLVPLLNYGEVLALLNGTLNSQSRLYTSEFIKMLKDIIIVGVCMFGTLELTFKTIVNKQCSKILILIGIVILSAALSVLKHDLLIILYGLRWSYPIFLCIFLQSIADIDLQRKVLKILLIVFSFALLLQFVQLFFIKGWFGYFENTHLSKRNPGVYLIPSSMAIFSIMTAYYVQHFMKKGWTRGLYLFVLVPLSVFLTGSGTGILILVMLFLADMVFMFRQRIGLMSLLIIIPVLIFLSLPLLTNRGDIFTSIETRGEIFTKAFDLDKTLLSSDFGVATNTAVIATSGVKTDGGEENLARPFVADSLITSFIYNAGLFPFLLFLLILFSVFRFKLIHIHFLIIVLVSMVTIITFELYPFILFLPLNLAFLWNYNKKLNVDEKQYSNFRS